MNKTTRNPERGFTLVEVLIATTITLLMMAALAQGFKRLSDGMAVGRAKLTLNDRLRSVGAILRSDLEGVTIRPAPPTGSLRGTGYFEYYDGPITDYSTTVNNLDLTAATDQEKIPTSRFGDVDDVLMFTAKATGEPFKGKVPRAIIKARQNVDAGLAPGAGITTIDWNTYDIVASDYAEIIYFMLPVMSADSNGNLVNPATGVPNAIMSKNPGFPDEYRLFRRVLLIRPDLNIPLQSITSTTPALSLTGHWMSKDFTIPILPPTHKVHWSVLQEVRRSRWQPLIRFAIFRSVESPIRTGPMSIQLLPIRSKISRGARIDSLIGSCLLR